MLITTFGAHILWQALMWEFYLHWLILNNPVRDILLTSTSGQWVPKGTRIWNEAGRNTKINELPVFPSNATCTGTVGHAEIRDYDSRLASAIEILKRHLNAFFFSSSYFSCKPLPSCNPSGHWDRKAASTESTTETMVSGLLFCSETSESLGTSENTPRGPGSSWGRFWWDVGQWAPSDPPKKGWYGGS